MFLIAAFIIAITLILLRMNIKIPTLQEQIKLMEITLEDNIANNFQNEIKNSAKYSVKYGDSITTNVFDFANFTERKATEHAMEFKLLFVGLLANYSISSINVSVINMLNEPIDATLSLNGTIGNSEVADNSRWDTSFSFTPGSTYLLMISYNSTYSQNVSVKTKNNKDIYVGFFDTTLKTPDSLYRNSSYETYNIH